MGVTCNCLFNKRILGRSFTDKCRCHRVCKVCNNKGLRDSTGGGSSVGKCSDPWCMSLGMCNNSSTSCPNNNFKFQPSQKITNTSVLKNREPCSKCSFCGNIYDENNFMCKFSDKNVSANDNSKNTGGLNDSSNVKDVTGLMSEGGKNSLNYKGHTTDFSKDAYNFNQKIDDNSLNNAQSSQTKNDGGGAQSDSPLADDPKGCPPKANLTGSGSRLDDISSNDRVERKGVQKIENKDESKPLDDKQPTVDSEHKRVSIYDFKLDPRLVKKFNAKWHYILIVVIWYNLDPFMFCKVFYNVSQLYIHMYYFWVASCIFSVFADAMYADYWGKDLLKSLLPLLFRICDIIADFILKYSWLIVERFLMANIYLLNKFDSFVFSLRDMLFCFLLAASLLIPAFFMILFDEMVALVSRILPNLYYKFEESIIKKRRSYAFILVILLILLILHSAFVHNTISVLFKILCALICSILVKISNLFFAFFCLHQYGEMASDFLFAIYCWCTKSSLMLNWFDLLFLYLVAFLLFDWKLNVCCSIPHWVLRIFFYFFCVGLLYLSFLVLVTEMTFICAYISVLWSVYIW